MRILILVLVTLAGCSPENPNVCGMLPTRFAGTTPETASDQLQVTSFCVERWAARLAPAPDTASDVASAVVDGACDDAIYYLEEKRKQETKGYSVPFEAVLSDWRGRAKFIVIQTRAGHCNSED